VVLGIDQPYSKEPGCAAEIAAQAILESRGNSPRLYRNTLVFLALDRARWQDMDEALRRYLAWSSILEEKETLNLDPFQVKQAETQKRTADSVVSARLPEAYQWLLVPVQAGPHGKPDWQALRMTGSEPLAVRASKKLRNDELLVPTFAATRLRMELDRVPLWRGNHVSIKQLASDFAQYLYLPRLSGSAVLIESVSDGVGLLTWALDSFAYADSYDESAGRYRGLRAGQNVSIGSHDLPGLVVKPDIARKQADDAERREDLGAASLPNSRTPPLEGDTDRPPPGEDQQRESQPRRYHGSVQLDATRVGRDAGRIAEEVIAHLSALPGADVEVTLEISARVAGGVPPSVVRIVAENGRTLRFLTHNFEKE